MTGRRGVPVAALLLVVGGACGGGSGGATATAPSTAGGASGIAPGGPTAPPADATEAVRRKLVEEQRARTPGLTVGAADCPEGAPAGTAGASTVCTVTVEGVPVPYTVTLLGSAAETEGGGESYELHLARPMVDVTELVTDIRTQASTLLKVAPERVAVDCGPAKVHVLDIGGRITCTVDDGHSTRRLAAVVTDGNGSTKIDEI